ncbi:GlxA family transcriptional regulator [Microbacterium gorillae]|uniref:GlxA family transcriptional regulator n=1 Tax=Microbacterium gorillae TaxID=1231063 RepID=UPI00058FE483
MLRVVAVVAESGVTPFEFGIAAEAFGLDRSDDGVPNFDFRVVTPEPGPVLTSLGLPLVIDRPLVDADDADVLVVLPTPSSTWGSGPDAVVDLIRRTVDRGAWVVAVCSGAFRLAQAGVLDGQRATTHWRYSDVLAEMYPAIDVDRDALYVQQGRIITSAGTAAGIDACLHLLRQTIGAEHTNTIARRMVVPPQRDGGQAQFVRRPVPLSLSLSLAPVAEWAVENLHDDLTVEVLATRAHMSPRTFARRFRADYGVSPAAWIARRRVDLAQRLLEQTDDDIEAVAQSAGFGSATVLRQNFSRVLGTSPTAYRQRFSGVSV